MHADHPPHNLPPQVTHSNLHPESLSSSYKREKKKQKQRQITIIIIIKKDKKIKKGEEEIRRAPLWSLGRELEKDSDYARENE